MSWRDDLPPHASDRVDELDAEIARLTRELHEWKQAAGVEAGDARKRQMT